MLWFGLATEGFNHGTSPSRARRTSRGAWFGLTPSTGADQGNSNSGYNLRAMSAPETTWSAARGRLKVFLGYASGVGKSFRMFDEGRRRKERGQDVVVGALQPKLPTEVEPLLASLEIVPTVNVKSVPVMDVEAILKRRPEICLVDGLAYDNPLGSRNAHRWQDVEELLAAGITIVATVNLQYIDDQRDAVKRLTGKRVTQSVPRAFLNTADEIVVVDAPTEASTERRSALREMALVLSADVIDAGLQRYMQSHGIEQPLGMHERFLICLTPRANLERMIATARTNAARFHCDVLAIYVQQPDIPEMDRKLLENGLQKAREEGAQVAVLDGDDPVETIVRFARSHGVTQIFVGHSARKDLRARMFGSPVSRLVRAARGIDVRVFPH
jgi:two-component system, OmpR family, sensor histidine kinase KdpD